MNFSKGKYGESLACAYLQKHGLKLLEKNFRTPIGEIDLIMLEQETIVFVEVKYRSSLRFGNPLESVDLRKQRKIKQVSYYYLSRFTHWPACRFDVLGIIGTEIYWVKGAFA